MLGACVRGCRRHVMEFKPALRTMSRAPRIFVEHMFCDMSGTSQSKNTYRKFLL